MNKSEIYFAFFAVGVAMANIVMQIVSGPELFLRPFSIGLSVMIFYFAYRELRNWDVIKVIKKILFTHHLEQEAFKEAKKYIQNLKQEEAFEK